jgi:CheY-like chemotaxis protein
MTHRAVLYVEDEADDVFFMERAFRKAGLTHTLYAVRDGRQAIAYLAGEQPFTRQTHPLPCAVLLDLNLPQISGFDVLSWVRAHPELRTMPVVIFSSSGRREDRERAEKLGATHYLLKPISGLEFVSVATELKATLFAADP